MRFRKSQLSVTWITQNSQISQRNKSIKAAVICVSHSPFRALFANFSLSVFEIFRPSGSFLIMNCVIFVVFCYDIHYSVSSTFNLFGYPGVVPMEIFVVKYNPPAILFTQLLTTARTRVGLNAREPRSWDKTWSIFPWVVSHQPARSVLISKWCARTEYLLRQVHSVDDCREWLHSSNYLPKKKSPWTLKIERKWCTVTFDGGYIYMYIHTCIYIFLYI